MTIETYLKSVIETDNHVKLCSDIAKAIEIFIDIPMSKHYTITEYQAFLIGYLINEGYKLKIK